jgi:hypothetical protein
MPFSTNLPCQYWRVATIVAHVCVDGLWLRKNVATSWAVAAAEDVFRQPRRMEQRFHQDRRRQLQRQHEAVAGVALALGKHGVVDGDDEDLDARGGVAVEDAVGDADVFRRFYFLALAMYAALLPWRPGHFRSP